MATTRSRPRGRETARPQDSAGAFGDHKGKTVAIAIAGIVVIIAVLATTSIGRTIDLATQHFMLFYAGVFALIALCASVGAGLVSTDRIVLNPGHRVFMQSIHRAISFGALAFLVIHVVTEILAQRIHIIDAFVPFLQPFRTFYIGLGTISSDLIILLVITSIFRKRFTANGKGVWRWRAIHYSAYVAFVFGVWHGLLGGRPGKPYVDWSYGFVVAFVALGIAVRVLANSLRPKENLSSAPVADSASSGSAPMRAAAMFAQLGATRPGIATAITGSAPVANMLPSGGAWNPGTGPVAALPAGAPSAAYQTAPVYEPGYDGPPRYAGAPQAGPGGMSGGYERPMTGPMPTMTGPMPTMAGPMPPMAGPMPPMPGPMPMAPGGPSGPHQQPPSGPMPVAPGGMSGGQRRPAPGAPRGPMPPDPGMYQQPTQQWDDDPRYRDPGPQPDGGYYGGDAWR